MESNEVRGRMEGAECDGLTGDAGPESLIKTAGTEVVETRRRATVATGERAVGRQDKLTALTWGNVQVEILMTDSLKPGLEIHDNVSRAVERISGRHESASHPRECDADFSKRQGLRGRHPMIPIRW